MYAYTQTTLDDGTIKQTGFSSGVNVFAFIGDLMASKMYQFFHTTIYYILQRFNTPRICVSLFC